MSERELRVRKIGDGTVIDHISAGNALKVCKILEIDENVDTVVSIAMNVPSSKLGKKDVVKIEGRELDPAEVDKIALIAPYATINYVRNYEIFKKHRVKLPQKIEGFPKCLNPNCVTNSNEPVTPKFMIEKDAPLRLRCIFCDRSMDQDDVHKALVL